MSGRSDDARSIASDSPVVTSLPFLPWENVSPTTVCVPGWVITNLCFMACEFSQLAATQRFLASASCLYLTLSDHAASRVLSQLGSLRAFETVQSPHGLRAAFGQARNTALEEGSLPLLHLTQDDFSLSSTPPAPASAAPSSAAPQRRRTRTSSEAEEEPSPPLVTAPPSVLLLASKRFPVPAALHYIHTANDTTFQTSGLLPLADLADFCRILGHTACPSALDDPTADVHLVAERLRAALTAFGGVPSPSNALLSATIPTFLRAQAIFPAELLSHSYSRHQVAEEFADRCVWASSDDAVTSRIERKRVRHALHLYFCLASVLARFENVSCVLVAVDRLVAAFMSAAKPARISVLLPELEIQLELRKELVQHTVSRAPDGPALIASLLSETRTHADAGGGSPSLPANATAGETPRIREAALSLAMRSKEFLDLEHALQTTVDFSSAQQQIDALDLAFGSNCVLVTRFLVSPTAELRGRHFVFNQLQLCMPELLTYFSQCQAFDNATRTIHAEAGRYSWHLPSLRLLFKGKFAEIDWLNSSSGALALKRHLAGISYETVVEADMYTVAAALDEFAAFGMRTFAALGDSPTPASGGLSFADFVAMQKGFVSFASALGQLERRACMAVANTEFRRALAYAKELFTTQITSASPAAAALDHFLPSGSAYELALNAQRDATKPIAALRSAFPGLLASAKALSLPGTSSQSARGNASAPAHSRQSNQFNCAGAQSAQRAPAPAPAPAPAAGNKSNLAV